jgi:GT2 family glycosyltransferase
VTGANRLARWGIDGKFFRIGTARVHLMAVTYGPFPGGWPESFDTDFQRIVAAGFNAIRLYEMPDTRLLDAAAAHGLAVFGGLKWGQNADFLNRPALFSAARVNLVQALRETAGHPAMVGCYVANEIPADLVRWMGPLRVRLAIEELIALARESAPHLLFAYSNYPSTEYLEPENADFTAFNIYLEDPSAFRSYLKRLHHIAGDRPLVISEFGLDSRRNGPARQAEVLQWAVAISREEETAGTTIYAWSDRWWNAGAEVLDWDFGLIDRQGNDKPALAALRRPGPQAGVDSPSFSVIICTRNGRSRIGRCLRAARKLDGANHEIIVVDDGSDDGTGTYVAAEFPEVRLVELAACGLSAARNAGASAALGEIFAFTDDDCEPDHEWLLRLGRLFRTGRYAAVGGPNLPPAPRSWEEAVVCAAPGAPSHVMIDDEEAEHLPGCNLAVTRAAFEAIGGFDPAFRTAGDDVDFCWRLREAGHVLGFAPGAFVWHWRRPSILAFLRQQRGYGAAERLLIAKHPGKFSKRGGARWEGFVYGGGAVRVMAGSMIYHGHMGRAGYQSVINRMLPLRAIAAPFDRWHARSAHWWVRNLIPRIRAWHRSRRIILGCHNMETSTPEANEAPAREFALAGISRDALLGHLLQNGWHPCGPSDSWDAQRQDSRLLLATEYDGNGSSHLLVRVQSEAALHDFCKLLETTRPHA